MRHEKHLGCPIPSHVYLEPTRSRRDGDVAASELSPNMELHCITDPDPARVHRPKIENRRTSRAVFCVCDAVNAWVLWYSPNDKNSATQRRDLGACQHAGMLKYLAFCMHGSAGRCCYSGSPDGSWPRRPAYFERAAPALANASHSAVPVPIF